MNYTLNAFQNDATACANNLFSVRVSSSESHTDRKEHHDENDTNIDGI